MQTKKTSTRIHTYVNVDGVLLLYCIYTPVICQQCTTIPYVYTSIICLVCLSSNLTHTCTAGTTEVGGIFPLLRLHVVRSHRSVGAERLKKHARNISAPLTANTHTKHTHTHARRKECQTYNTESGRAECKKTAKGVYIEPQTIIPYDDRKKDRQNISFMYTNNTHHALHNHDRILSTTTGCHCTLPPRYSIVCILSSISQV